jgi:outer membrane protein assembly factor BamB
MKPEKTLYVKEIANEYRLAIIETENYIELAYFHTDKKTTIFTTHKEHLKSILAVYNDINTYENLQEVIWYLSNDYVLHGFEEPVL